MAKRKRKRGLAAASKETRRRVSIKGGRTSGRKKRGRRMKRYAS